MAVDVGGTTPAPSKPTESQIRLLMNSEDYKKLQELFLLITKFRISCKVFDDKKEGFSFGISVASIDCIEKTINNLDKVIVQESENREVFGLLCSPLQFNTDLISWLMEQLQKCIQCGDDFHAASQFSAMWRREQDNRLTQVVRSFTSVIRTPTQFGGGFKQIAESHFDEIEKSKPGSSGPLIQGKLMDAMKKLMLLMQKNLEEVDKHIRFNFFDKYIASCTYFENTSEHGGFLSLRNNIGILKMFIGSGCKLDRNKNEDYLYIFTRLLEASTSGDCLPIFSKFVEDPDFLDTACEDDRIVGALILHCQKQRALYATPSNTRGIIAIISSILSSLLIKMNALAGRDGEGIECRQVLRFFKEVDESTSLYEGDILRIFIACLANIMQMTDKYEVQSCLKTWIVSCLPTRCFYWVSKDERVLNELDKTCNGSKPLFEALESLFPSVEDFRPLIAAQRSLHILFNPVILENTQILQRLLTSDDAGSAHSVEHAAVTVLAKLLVWVSDDLQAEDYKKLFSDNTFKAQTSLKIDEFSAAFHQFQKYYKTDPFSDFGDTLQSPLMGLVLKDAVCNRIVAVHHRLEHIIGSFDFLNDTFLGLIGWDKNLGKVIKLMDVLEERELEKFVGLAMTSHKSHTMYRAYKDRIKNEADDVICLLKAEIAKTATNGTTIFKKVDVYHTFISALDNLSTEALDGIMVADEAAKGRVKTLSEEAESEYLDLDMPTTLGLIFLKLICRRIHHAKSDIDKLCYFGYSLSDAVERKISMIKFDPKCIVDGFGNLNNLNLPSTTLPDPLQLTKDVEQAAKDLFTRYQGILEQKLVDCIQYNQSLAFSLIVKNSKNNVFLKVGTGQGKSFIIGMAVARIAGKIAAESIKNHRIYVLTSYSHLAVRDHSSMALLYGQAKAGSMVLVSVDNLDGFSSSVLVIHADTKDFTRIVRTALLRVYAGTATDGEVEFLRSVYGDKNTVFLDEYDLLVEDLDEADANGIMDVSAHGFLPADVDGIKGRFGKLKYLIKTPGATAAEREVVDEYDCRKGRMVVLYDAISKVLRLDPGVFSLSRFLSNSRRIVGLSGSTAGENTAFHNDKENVFYQVPLFQDPTTSSSASCISRVRETQGITTQEGWIAALLDDIAKAREQRPVAAATTADNTTGSNAAGVHVIRPVLVFVERSPASQEDWDSVRDAIKTRFGGVDELHDEAEVTDLRLQTIAAPGSITMTTVVCGRGADIRCSRDVLGGLHVLVSFMPMHNRLLDQMKGRTGRMGRAGSYSLITKKVGYQARRKNANRIEEVRKGHDETKKLLEDRDFRPKRSEGLVLMCRLTEERFDAALVLVLISSSGSMQRFIEGVKTRMVSMMKALEGEAPGAFRFHFQYFRGMKVLIKSGGIEEADRHLTGETFDGQQLSAFLQRRGSVVTSSGWGLEGVPFAVEAVVKARAAPVPRTSLRRAVIITDDSSERFTDSGGPVMSDMLDDWANRAGVPVDAFVIENGAKEFKDATKAQMTLVCSKTGGTYHALDAVGTGDGQAFVSALRGCFVGGAQRGGD